ncbi:alpha/beta hydrolase [Pelagibaculum spongiae]|nr:alpha/beta hydrolase [Pelagibaculum spongiae]
MSHVLYSTTASATGQTSADLPNLQDCFLDGLTEKAQCGKISVPENYQKPDGKRIDIYFARIPAIKNIPGNAPLLAIAGGPGQSAIDSARIFSQVFYRTRQDRDLILIDQRGTGRSNLLQCEDQNKRDLSINDQLLDIAQLAKECLQQLSKESDVAQYGSLTALKDLEYVRKHLQIEQWHLYGISYGTRMAQLYMRLYPQSLVTVTLDGVVPMQHSVITIGSAINRAFTQLMDDCSNNQDCQNSYPNLQQQLTQLTEQLAENPIKIQVNDPITAEPKQFLITQNKLLGSLRMAMYTPSIRTMIPLIIDHAAKGNYQPLLGLYGSSGGASGNNGIALGMHMAVACGEDFYRLDPKQAEKLKQSSAIAAETVKLFTIACPIWNIPAVGKGFSQPIESEIPTLLLSGNLDPATPPSWGEMAKVRLKNNRHFIAPYATHGVAFQSCAANLIEQMIEEKSVENLDDSCLKKDTRRDFFLNANGRSSKQLVDSKPDQKAQNQTSQGATTND